MTEYFDDLETRAPDVREAALFSKLPVFLTKAMAEASGWASHLAGVDPAGVRSRDDLAKLPVLRKADLMAQQAANPPFGGFVVGAPGSYPRIFMSPGPVWEPQGIGADPWRGARALFAAGFRKGDVVHNALSYHLTPGGFILDEAACALGCSVFPAGVGNSQVQVDAIEVLKPRGFTGTPDYLMVLLDYAREHNKDVSSIRNALVSGGALFPSLRQAYADRGVEVSQCYATADLGVIAYETSFQDGLIVNEDILVEIVRPGTGDPVAAGEVGEIVVTSLNPSYPLIRFGTGDLSAFMEGQSPCGRTNMRIKGWMGRADQRTKVKGMFVDPKQVDMIVQGLAGVNKARLVVERSGAQDVMILRLETSSVSDALSDQAQKMLRDVTNLSGTVQLVEPGDLPNDGKVIADDRPYD